MSAWEFHVGQKVCCISDVSKYRSAGHIVPEVGKVYHISRIEAFKAGQKVRSGAGFVGRVVCDGVFLTLSELGDSVAFDADDFRPLRERKTSIECFRALLNPTEKKVEA